MSQPTINEEYWRAEYGGSHLQSEHSSGWCRRRMTVASKVTKPWLPLGPTIYFLVFLSVLLYFSCVCASRSSFEFHVIFNTCIFCWGAFAIWNNLSFQNTHIMYTCIIYTHYVCTRFKFALNLLSKFSSTNYCTFFLNFGISTASL